MDLHGKAGQAKPAQADQRPGFLGLTRKQKSLLWFAFSLVVVAGTATGAYVYISSAPQRGQTQFLDAMRLMRPGYYGAAIREFDKALKIWPHLGEAYFERGNANRAMGRDEEALADYERAVNENPSLYRAFASMGSIYSARHDYKRAMEMFTKSIDAKSSVDAYFERGQSYEALGEHQKALQDYDRAIAEMPDAPEVYRARGLVRRALGDQAGYESDRDMASSIEHRH